MSETKTKCQYAANYRKPPLHTRSEKGRSGNRHGRHKKHLPALLVAALNEPVYITTNGRRRKVTKREAVIAQLVNESGVIAESSPNPTLRGFESTAHAPTTPERAPARRLPGDF